MSAQTPPDPPRDAKAELKAAKAYAKASRPWYKKKRFIALGLFALLVIISVAAGGGSESDKSASDSDTPTPSSESPANGDDAPSDDDSSSCTNTATEDYTPDVASNQSVRVDALTWRILSTRVAATLGNQQFGAGAKADDVFSVVTLKVTSNKDESATISDERVKLETIDDNTYSSEQPGHNPALGSGEDPLFLEDLGPDQTTTSRLVFDFPAHKSGQSRGSTSRPSGKRTDTSSCRGPRQRGVYTTVRQGSPPNPRRKDRPP